MAAKASFFPYVAAAPAEAQPPLKNEAAALRKSLADKAKHNEATAAQRRTLDARRGEKIQARRESRKAERVAATRQAVHATRVALAKRVETARFAAEAAAERCATADAAAASRAQERADAALERRRTEFKKAVEKAKKRFDDVAQVWARRDRRTNDRLRDQRVLATV
jgi:hypothetical protein